MDPVDPWLMAHSAHSNRVANSILVATGNVQKSVLLTFGLRYENHHFYNAQYQLRDFLKYTLLKPLSVRRSVSV